MVSSVNSNMSALGAMSTKMNVTAHNVANVNTDGFESQDAVLEESPQGGVEAVVRQGEQLKEPVATGATGDIQMESLSNVDLATEMTDTISTSRMFEANTKMLQADDEMKGSLLNMVG